MNNIPIQKSNRLFSLYYENDGFNIKGERLMGRQAAGWSFLKSIIQSNEYAKLAVYLKDISQRDLLVDDIKAAIRDKKDKIELEFIPYKSPFLSAPYGGIQLPGPDLTNFAKHRSFFGHHKYSLVGLTHTTASHQIMSSFSSILTEPIMPWDAIICTSESVLGTLNKIIEKKSEFLDYKFGIKDHILPKFPVIPLGVNCDEFMFSDDFIQKSRKELGIDKDDIVIGYVGRLSFHAKAHHIPMYTALESCAKSLKGTSKIHLIQTGWFANDFIENAFKSEAELICPNVNCIFLDGKDQSNKYKTLAAMDIFMSLSDNIQETFGLTPLEGMASGKPVIVSDWNGYRSTVRDNEDGFRIKSYSLPNGFGEGLARQYMSGEINYDHYIGHSSQRVAIDIKDCIDKLTILITDKNKREEIGNCAKERAKIFFSWNNILKQYEELYDELNSIRMSEYKNYEFYSQPKQPSDRLDPFYLFDDYPSELFSGNTNFFVTDKVQSYSLDDFFKLGSINFAVNGLPNVKIINDLFVSLNKDEIYSINSLLKKSKINREEIFLTVIFLIKYGFLTTFGKNNE